MPSSANPSLGPTVTNSTALPKSFSLQPSVTGAAPSSAVARLAHTATKNVGSSRASWHDAIGTNGQMDTPLFRGAPVSPYTIHPSGSPASLSERILGITSWASDSSSHLCPPPLTSLPPSLPTLIRVERIRNKQAAPGTENGEAVAGPLSENVSADPQALSHTPIAAKANSSVNHPTVVTAGTASGATPVPFLPPPSPMDIERLEKHEDIVAEETGRSAQAEAMGGSVKREGSCEERTPDVVMGEASESSPQRQQHQQQQQHHFQRPEVGSGRPLEEKGKAVRSQLMQTVSDIPASVAAIVPPLASTTDAQAANPQLLTLTVSQSADRLPLIKSVAVAATHSPSAPLAGMNEAPPSPATSPPGNYADDNVVFLSPFDTYNTSGEEVIITDESDYLDAVAALAAGRDPLREKLPPLPDNSLWNSKAPTSLSSTEELSSLGLRSGERRSLPEVAHAWDLFASSEDRWHAVEGTRPSASGAHKDGGAERSARERELSGHTDIVKGVDLWCATGKGARAETENELLSSLLVPSTASGPSLLASNERGVGRQSESEASSLAIAISDWTRPGLAGEEPIELSGGQLLFRQLQMDLLDMETAVGQVAGATCVARGLGSRRRAWRALVKATRTIRELAQACILLEWMISRDNIATSWRFWSSPAGALESATLPALALRVHALDEAIVYSSQRTGGRDAGGLAVGGWVVGGLAKANGKPEAGSLKGKVADAEAPKVMGMKNLRDASGGSKGGVTLLGSKANVKSGKLKGKLGKKKKKQGRPRKNLG
eukprot:TRINITY_DN1503_c3_g1_i1.p1 TRINITY_DN1503_c3_g1~~TRINITY_DN1503_c3_g1_i1.p1  ORF type:complete len:857 (-),score=154.18 TRINITY_DN1503_c3_g1_i1:21-2351(-)